MEQVSMETILIKFNTCYNVVCIEKLGYSKTHYLIHRLIKLNTTNIYKT